jgi:hypothetical protein
MQSSVITHTSEDIDISDTVYILCPQHGKQIAVDPLHCVVCEKENNAALNAMLLEQFHEEMKAGYQPPYESPFDVYDADTFPGGQIDDGDLSEEEVQEIRDHCKQQQREMFMM